MLDEGAALLGGASKLLADALGEGEVAYGDHVREGERVRAFPNPGDVTDRFPFGPVRAYRSETLLKAPEAPFQEYAIWLDVVGRGGRFIRVDSPVSRSGGGREHSALHSSGEKGGSFAYLLSGKERERAAEATFKAWLREQGAFLSGGFLPPPPDRGELRVTVITPVLNRAGHIARPIASLLAQTFADYEHIVVDNGSEDGTPEAALACAGGDPRFRVVRREGGVISEALNAGLRAARGRYVAQLDSDDAYTPDALAAAVAFLDAHPQCGMAISYYELVDEAGRPIRELPVVEHLEYDRNNLLRVEGAGALRIYRRAVLEELGGFNVTPFGSFGEDYDAVLKAGERYEVGRIHKVLYRYTRHADSTDARIGQETRIRLKTLARRLAIERRRRMNGVEGMARGLGR